MELTQGGSEESQGPYPRGHRVDAPRIENAVRELLIAIGEDPEREGLRGTPRRSAKPTRSSSPGLLMTQPGTWTLGSRKNIARWSWSGTYPCIRSANITSCRWSARPTWATYQTGRS